MKEHSNRIKSLDGLRALAMILVLFSHSIWKFQYQIEIDFKQFSLINVLYNGWVGVELFFVLSGFLIASQLLNKPINLATYMPYVCRRFFRIAPAYYLATVFTLLYISIIPVIMYNTGTNLLSHWGPSVLTHILFINDYLWQQPYVDGIFWSIPVEMKFYILLPLILFFLLKIKNCNHRILGIIVFYCFYLIFKVNNLHDTFGLKPISYEQYFFSIKSLFHFAIDGLIAGVLAAFILNSQKFRNFQNPRFHFNLLFSLVLFSFFLISMHPYFYGGTVSFWERFLPRAAYALVFFTGLLCLVKGCWANRFFELPIFNYLAQISYSVYLLQIFALSVQHAIFWKCSTYIDSGLVCWLISLPFLFLFAFGIGHLMYVYVEKPIILWSKRKWPSQKL